MARNVRGGWAQERGRNNADRDEGGTTSNEIKPCPQKQLSRGCESIAVLFMEPRIFWAVAV